MMDRKDVMLAVIIGMLVAGALLLSVHIATLMEDRTARTADTPQCTEVPINSIQPGVDAFRVTCGGSWTICHVVTDAAMTVEHVGNCVRLNGRLYEIQMAGSDGKVALQAVDMLHKAAE